MIEKKERSLKISLPILTYCLFMFGLPIEKEDDYACIDIATQPPYHKEQIYSRINNCYFRTSRYGNKTYDMFLDTRDKIIYYIIHRTN